jgi:signal peptidase I
VGTVYRFFAWVLVICAGLFGILRATAIRVWQVPVGDAELGASLAPVLEAGDWIFLWRLTPPSMGSLVLCPDPDDAQNVVVGRIVARGGDLVTIDKGVASVNSQPLDADANCKERRVVVPHPESGEPVELACELERVADVVHPRAFRAANVPSRKFETRVRKGHFFLLSDNRAFPFDSRHFGTVPEVSCTETVFFRAISQRGFFDVDRRLTYIK